MSEAEGSAAGTAPAEIVIVVAVAKNGVIGRDNDLPWRLSSDLKRFRALTMGRPIVMGRKTFQSIGRPLDGRRTIVVTRDPGFQVDGVETVGSIEAAIARGRAVATETGAGEVMITGGGEIYAQALAHADRVELTEVDLTPETAGAALFPTLEPADWQETARIVGERGERDAAEFAFVTYRRRDASRPS